MSEQATRDLLDALMCEVLAKMSVISEQKAHDYEKSRVMGGDHNGAPAPLIDKPLADYYRDRFANAYSWASRRAVVLDAVKALEVARRMPLVDGQEPDMAHPQWKRFIAESPLDGGTLARRFGVSRQYIFEVRKAWRNAA